MHYQGIEKYQKIKKMKSDRLDILVGQIFAHHPSRERSLCVVTSRVDNCSNSFTDINIHLDI